MYVLLVYKHLPKKDCTNRLILENSSKVLPSDIFGPFSTSDDAMMYATYHCESFNYQVCPVTVREDQPMLESIVEEVSKQPCTMCLDTHCDNMPNREECLPCRAKTALLVYKHKKGQIGAPNLPSPISHKHLRDVIELLSDACCSARDFLVDDGQLDKQDLINKLDSVLNFVEF